MAVSYKRLLHMMIEKDVSNAQLMHDAGISANIITKLKNGQYMPTKHVALYPRAVDLPCCPAKIDAGRKTPVTMRFLGLFRVKKLM